MRLVGGGRRRWLGLLELLVDEKGRPCCGRRVEVLVGEE